MAMRIVSATVLRGHCTNSGADSDLARSCGFHLLVLVGETRAAFETARYRSQGQQLAPTRQSSIRGPLCVE